ncbi:MAG: hypothetical protein ABJD55_07710, partial [Flavobacteriaceae bacterium]
DNDIFRAVPRPFARLQLYFQSPIDFGPELFGTKPLANWQFVPLVSWQAGSYITYTGGAGALEGVENNLQTRDFWGTSLRLTKTINLSSGGKFKIFADVSNVINRRNFNIFNSGLTPTGDFEDYMSSLHLPYSKLEEIGLQNSRLSGNDKVGDYRPHDIEYVPIEYEQNLLNISNPSGRALYYNAEDGNYYRYMNGVFEQADQSYVGSVLDNKAYINMPNQRFFNFLDPRQFNIGIRFSF